PLADLALKVSVDEVNRQSGNFNLHRTNSRVIRQLSIIRDTRPPLGSFSPGIILCQGALDRSRLLL
ncbi:uncharacterized protein LOC143723966, partial [Siphateles boraxobius]|uniref:uncharacterized protein LOC143723966 n=1 Tax=Siphateles boraxobius TaxID=180520 RepID=UPI0040631D5B